MSQDTPIRTLLKGGAIALSGNGFIYALAFVFQVYLARLLGAETFGVWGFAYTLILILAQLCTIGLGYSAIYFVSRHDTPGVPRPHDIGRAALLLVSVSSLCCMVLLPLATHFWIVPTYHYENLEPLLLILTAAIPLLAFVSIAESLFRAYQDAAAAYKVKIVPELLKLLIIPAGIILLGANVVVVGALMLLVLLVPAAYAGYILKKMTVPLHPSVPTVFRTNSVMMLTYAFPFFLLEIANLMRDRVDTFIIGYLATPQYLGIYKGAFVLASAVYFVPNSISYLLFPVLNRVIAGNNREQLTIIGERIMKIFIYAGVPAIIALVVFSRPLMIRVFGAGFLDGERSLLLLTLAAGMSLFHTFSGNVLGAQKRLKWLLVANGAALALTIILNVFLLPSYGITGSAVAALSGAVLLTALVLAFAAKSTGRFIFPESTLGALLLAGGTIAAAWVFRSRSFFDSVELYAFFAVAWGTWIALVEKKEIAGLRHMLRSRLGRGNSV